MAETINRVQLITLYKEINAVFPYVKPLADDNTVMLFQGIYNGFTYKELKAALDKYAAEQSTPPKPADLIKLAKDARYQRNMAQSYRRYDDRKTYECRFCQDSGYMQVIAPGCEPDSFRASCICKRPQVVSRLKTQGWFGFFEPKWGLRLRLRWEQALQAFVPVEYETARPTGQLMTAAEMIAAVDGQFDLPF